MTEQITNSPRPLEIKFGESAKWHIKALCQGHIDVNNAAQSLKFLLDNIDKIEGRETFMKDLKAFIMRQVAKTSTDSEKTVHNKGNELFEALVEAMQRTKEGPDLTRKFGVSMSKIEKRIGQLPA